MRKVGEAEVVAVVPALMNTDLSTVLTTARAASTSSATYHQISWRAFSKVCSVAVDAILTVPAVAGCSRL